MLVREPSLRLPAYRFMRQSSIRHWIGVDLEHPGSTIGECMVDSAVFEVRQFEHRAQPFNVRIVALEFRLAPTPLC